MTEMAWTDSTGYSRGAPRIQTCWAITIGPIRVCVMTSHIYFRPNWAYLIEPLMQEPQGIPDIDPSDVAAAQKVALIKARALLVPYVEAFNILEGVAE